MFGICRNKNMKWYNWLTAWFQILDSLSSILTFEFWRIDTVGWWFYNCTPGFSRRKHSSIGDWFAWWYADLLMILKSLLIILTFGHIVCPRSK